jgi:tetratricopeptide (TPR) repeat protein
MTPTSNLLATIFLLALAAAAQTQPTSASELKLGVDAYRSAHYEEAIHHFQRATELDPNNIPAHLYLATAYVGQYIPGVASPDNVFLADQAINHYQHVLDSDADREQKINAAKGIAYLYLNIKKFDDARKFYQMASDLDPKDPEPYYSIGVIDWIAISLEWRSAPNSA